MSSAKTVWAILLYMNERSFIYSLFMKVDLKNVSKRDQLVHSALELFADNGYAATSVKAIANHASVSQGLLYNHFENKQALLVALMELGMADVQSTLDIDPQLPKFDKLKTLLSNVVALTQSNQAFWKLFYSLRFQPSASQALGDAPQLASTAIRMQLEGICTDLGLDDPELEARILFAEIDGICQHAALEPTYPLNDVMNKLLSRYEVQQ